ncbi:hypothetical protein AVEN_185705-1 [Araneus ventricosus]|uniref:Uncharacterized protein n=1 Tax=Araneus ventricosus TaxID=182803 RepID=A0A4Y2JFG5_ARAVE|nr:hypothetical protein AVEN_185705-1 [Araneus ventricosus]
MSVQWCLEAIMISKGTFGSLVKGHRPIYSNEKEEQKLVILLRIMDVWGVAFALPAKVLPLFCHQLKDSIKSSLSPAWGCGRFKYICLGNSLR